MTQTHLARAIRRAGRGGWAAIDDMDEFHVKYTCSILNKSMMKCTNNYSAIGYTESKNHLTPGDRVAWFDPNFSKVPRFRSNDRTKPEPNPNDFLGIYWGERSCKHRSPCLVGSTTGLGSSNARLLARRPASTASQMRPLRPSHLRTVGQESEQ